MSEDWCDYIDAADGRYVGVEEADAAIENLEAALAERDMMLQLAARERPFFELNGRMQTADDWLAELRRRSRAKKP